MSYLIEFFKKEIVRKFSVLILVAFFIFILRGVLDVFLLTFIFTYIIYSLQKFIKKYLDRFIRIRSDIIAIVLYLLLLVFVVALFYRYIPVVIRQCKELIIELDRMNYKDVFGDKIYKMFLPFFKGKDISVYFDKYSGKIDNVFVFITNIGKWGVNVILAFVLSVFFMIDREKVRRFLWKFQDSNISGFYKYLREFAISFLNSFGKVIQTQIIIAFINSLLSVVALSLMGFTQVLGLGLMIFVFSLVPVAGTVVSLIPLSIIAFKIGGAAKIISVVILIIVLHTFETYVLNPKLMSSKTELPVFMVFVVLIVSKHFMGVWGLLIGVPLFMFLLDFLDVKPINRRESVEDLKSKEE